MTARDRALILALSLAAAIAGWLAGWHVVAPVLLGGAR